MNRSAATLATITGAILGAGFGIAGYLLAGIPGEVVGVLIAIPLAFAVGLLFGTRA